MLLCVDCAVNLVPSFLVNGEIVLLTTMLLDLRHDFLFTLSADLPITVFGTYI
jgi:hypothetical protein